MSTQSEIVKELKKCIEDLEELLLKDIKDEQDWAYNCGIENCIKLIYQRLQHPNNQRKNYLFWR